MNHLAVFVQQHSDMGTITYQVKIEDGTNCIHVESNGVKLEANYLANQIAVALLPILGIVELRTA